MIDMFKIFNKVKIDTDKYKEINTDDNEDLKIKMKKRLYSSERMKNKRKKRNVIITTAASISLIMLGVGITNPSLADNIIKNISEFQSMLDKINESIKEDTQVEYNPKNYPEREEEKEEIKKNKLTATPINVSSKSNGLEITIDKAMYDKKKLYLDMTLKTDKSFEETDFINAVSDSPYGDGQKNMYIEDLKLLINGVEPISYGYGPGVVEFVDEHTLNLSYLLELSVDNNIEEANFNIGFSIPRYKNQVLKEKIDGEWTFNFDIAAMDDGKNHFDINKKDGDYTLLSVDVTNTYVEVFMELPFEPSLGNPHNNFIIVKDDNGRELRMSSGVDGNDGISNIIYELESVGQEIKYVDIFVIESYMDM